MLLDRPMRRATALLFPYRRAAVVAGAGLSYACARCEEGDENTGAPPARLRVLITGFHDWRDLDNNIWRCRDNPSCRIIYGSPCSSPPIVRAGPLVQALAATALPADVSFQTLPVLWGTASGLDLGDFDVVVHMGLGVYDRTDLLLLEAGAYNRRAGADALKQTAGHTIDAGDQVLDSPSMQERRASLVGPAESIRLDGGFELKLAPARPQNAYICNETHHRALKAQVAAAPGRGPLAVYFLHLPYALADDHTELAAAVSAVVCKIVRHEHPR